MEYPVVRYFEYILEDAEKFGHEVVQLVCDAYNSGVKGYYHPPEDFGRRLKDDSTNNWPS